MVRCASTLIYVFYQKKSHSPQVLAQVNTLPEICNPSEEKTIPIDLTPCIDVKKFSEKNFFLGKNAVFSQKNFFPRKVLGKLLVHRRQSFSRKNFPRKISDKKFSVGFLGKIEKSSRKSENPCMNVTQNIFREIVFVRLCVKI